MQATRVALAGFFVLTLSACSNEAEPTRTWEVAAQGVYTGAISPQGDMLIVGSLNHGASLWQAMEHKRLFNWSHQQGEFVELVAASFSPDGSRAVTTDPRTLVFWNTTTGEALNYWGTPGAVLAAAVLEDNRNVLLGLDNHSALLFDASNGQYGQTFMHKGEVGALSVQGDLFLTGSDDHTAALWRLGSDDALHTFQHGNPVRAVALSPSGRLSFTAAQGDLVAIWDNERGTRLHTLHDGLYHGAISARFSNDERTLAVGYANRKVSLFNVSDGRLIKTWDPGTRHTMRATGAAILEVAFNAQTGAILAITGDGRLLELSPVWPREFHISYTGAIVKSSGIVTHRLVTSRLA